MALLVGALLALALGLFATVSGLDRDRAFYPTVTIVIASYYCLFAVMGAPALAKVKDDLSRYLRLAAGEEIVITRDGRPAGIRSSPMFNGLGS